MTKYTARFQSGKEITKTSNDFKNRLDFLNWICKERMGKRYGRLVEITCTPYIK
jgi:hypothetical protein